MRDYKQQESFAWLEQEGLGPAGKGRQDARRGIGRRLRRKAIDCALISKLAADKTKRELFTKLAEHYAVLAAEVENAIQGPTRK